MRNRLNSLIRSVKSKALSYIVQELDKYPALYKMMNTPRTLMWRFMVNIRRSRLSKLSNLDKIYWINPNQIVFAIRGKKEMLSASIRGSVIGGDWDLPVNRIRFEETDVYQAFYERFVKQKAWKDTAFYSRILDAISKGDTKWGCNSEAQLDERYAKIDELYQDIRNNGYKTQVILHHDSQRHWSGDEIIVSIGRNGEMLFSDGRHRLCIAKILGLNQVPIQIGMRHPKWLEFRKQLFAEAKSQKTGKLYQPVFHPDLTDIPALYGDDRFELIKKNLLMHTGTLLDIGSYYGYFCHRFEDEGFDCYAVEYNPINCYIMEKIKQAENKRFKIFPGSIFDYSERMDFDVVLALNIFHHFMKDKWQYDKLIELLQRLKMRQMFYQPHKQDEPQMQLAFRNYTTEQSIDFLLEHSCLNQANYIGETQDGRPLYELH